MSELPFSQRTGLRWGEMRLSARERTILVLVASGRSDKDVARELNISVHTVHTYMSRIFRRNAFHTRTQAVAAWLLESARPGRVKPREPG